MPYTDRPVIPYGTVWRSLPTSAKDVYLALLYEVDAAGGIPVPFSYATAETFLRLPPSTFSRALKELLRRGFIVRIRRGGFPGRRSTLYDLSDAYQVYGLDGWELRRSLTDQQKADFQTALTKSWARGLEKFQIATENDRDEEYRRQLRRHLDRYSD